MTKKALPYPSAPGVDDLIAQLLTRLAAIFLRLGLDSPRTEHLLRKAFVDAAIKEIRAPDRRLTQTRLASLTGLSRLEVRTILRNRSSRGATRVDRILSAWHSDPQFLDARGKPKPLAVQGKGITFEKLAKKYGRDVPGRALREELIRRGIASEIGKNKLRLLPIGEKRSSEALAAYGDLRFLASLLTTIDFQFGRRAYVVRQSSITAENKKRAAIAKRIAVNRLETLLSSLAELSTDAQSRKQRKGKQRSRRLLISAVVATEIEEKSR